MKRVLTALLSAALLFGPAVPANAAPAVPGVCDGAAMKKIVELGYVWPTPWDNCQFKLFYPDGSLSWTEDEWFHGGDFFSIPATAENLPGTPGYLRLLGYYAQIEEHLYWGKEPRKMSELREVRLSRGPVRIYEGHDYGGRIFARETYHNFQPQAPGKYKWRYTWSSFEFGQFGDVSGHIRIEPRPGPSPGPTEPCVCL